MNTYLIGKQAGRSGHSSVGRATSLREGKILISKSGDGVPKTV